MGAPPPVRPLRRLYAQAMDDLGLQPDLYTYNALLSCAARPLHPYPLHLQRLYTTPLQLRVGPGLPQRASRLRGQACVHVSGYGPAPGPRTGL